LRSRAHAEKERTAIVELRRRHVHARPRNLMRLHMFVCRCVHVRVRMLLTMCVRGELGGGVG